MERYHDFLLKDHYFWTDAAPEYVTKDEREAAKPKPEPTKYESWTVIEEDGSTTYYDAKINTKPVILDGMMI